LVILAHLAFVRTTMDHRSASQEFLVRVVPKAQIVALPVVSRQQGADASLRYTCNTAAGYSLHLTLGTIDPQAIQAKTPIKSYRIWSDEAHFQATVSSGESIVSPMYAGTGTFHVAQLSSTVSSECTCVITVLPPL